MSCEGKWCEHAIGVLRNSQYPQKCGNNTSAGDMTKIAMINVAFDPEMRRMGAKLALSVHDELIVDCPKEHAEEVKERLEYLMIEAGRQKVKTVPITSEGIIMERWIKD